MMDERVARAALTRLVEPGEPRVVRLLARLGVAGLLAELTDELGELGHEVAGRAARLDAERDLEQAERRGIRFLIPGDAEWPASLDDLAHLPRDHRYLGVPIGLWVRGPLRLIELSRAVAVVGSRDSTTYGEAVAREIGAGVARAGHCVISGAAFGIDQAAHRGALAVEGSTVAMLACGVDRAYPSAHRELLDLIGRVGAVVSEVPPGTAPTRLRFLARNRVIAALSAGTVVVEAAVRSGALNTARYATGLSRPLMGVPGPVTSAQSEGVHQQITQGAASLVTGASDVLEVVAAAGEHLQEPKRGPETPRDRLGPLERRVLEAVPVHRSAGAEAIATTAGLAVGRTRFALTGLAGQGYVAAVGEGWRLVAQSRLDLPGIEAGDAYDR
jgi:DNA processing protein